MKTFRIGVFEEQGGYITIKATNKKMAIKKAQEHLDNYGFSDEYDHLVEGLETTHRGAEVFKGDITEIK
jgi:hypothetical protein